ncbi:MAG: hypothetical protein ABH806_00065 [Candidatus Omnitrophota bacterium]
MIPVDQIERKYEGIERIGSEGIKSIKTRGILPQELMEKIRYEIDPHNRLISRKAGNGAVPYLFRQVLDGEFKTDKKNNLAYHIKAPVTGGKKVSPYQVKLKGKWKLGKGHDLIFTLDKWKRQASGDSLTIRGDIIEVCKNALLFAVTTRSGGGNPSAYILKLEGAWQADEYNRLTFTVNKERGAPDILTFQGGWEIGKGYRIIYRYEKEDLLRKTKRTHTLVFKGDWEIKDKTRISYVIDRSSGSVMNFKTSAGIFKDNYIKYELGIGRLRKARPLRRAIVLFGSWKIKRGAGLIFEAECGRRKLQDITFGAEARITDKDTVLFRLKNGLNRNIGAELELKRRFLGSEGEAYLRLLHSGRKPEITAGAGWRW